MLSSDKHLLDAVPGLARWQLVGILLAGPVAWLVHLLLAWAIAEFGCLAGWGGVRWAGVTAVAWLILIISPIAAAVSGASLVMAHRLLVRLRPHLTEELEGGSSVLFMLRTGRWHGGFFLLVIAVQTLPIFFYLQRC